MQLALTPRLKVIPQTLGPGALLQVSAPPLTAPKFESAATTLLVKTLLRPEAQSGASLQLALTLLLKVIPQPPGPGALLQVGAPPLTAPEFESAATTLLVKTLS